MKRIALLLLLCLSSYCLLAQKQNQAYLDYIEKYKKEAIEGMDRFGVPASITLAQGLLESGAGRSELTKKSNNHFGIKCGRNWTGDKVYYDDDEKHECFRKYASALESYEDHCLFLKRNPRYASLFQLSKTDYKGWANGLKAAGYATNPRYAQLLIGLIEDYDLAKYDKMKSGAEPEKNFKAKPAETQASKPDAKQDGKKAEKKKKTKKAKSGEKKTALGRFLSQRRVQTKDEKERNRVFEEDEYIGEIAAFRSHDIKKVNGVKCVVAYRGDSYASIAEEFGKFESELLRYNEVKYGAQPKVGEYVYLQKKKKNGTAASYVAEEGETVYDIAQRTGIRMKSLYELNGLTYGKEVKAGDVLKLK
ncbi:MAG: glucosaminidase domain-containing protein [Paludibacteraceae bacterium]|nr:glucosaminidase domain-containing protein [Paludibacteraceae bacterium]